jgi:hypothetical protein
VLATKEDGVTSFRVLVECKAWNLPIEKDVVSKAHYVAGDIGANKVIIASLAGCRSGAEVSAQELGVGLWDAFDLEQRLGKASVAELRDGGGQRTLVGVRPAMAEEAALALLARQRAGVLGKEEIAWAKLAWLPCYFLTLRTTETERRMLGKTRAKSRAAFNLYEGLSGALIQCFDGELEFAEVTADRAVPPLIRDRKLCGEIEKTCAKLTQLVNPTAIERQRARVLALGVPLPFDAVSVDSVTTLHWPFFVGLLERKGSQRLVGVDTVLKRVSETTSRVLTENLAYVTSALEGRSG